MLYVRGEQMIRKIILFVGLCTSLPSVADNVFSKINVNGFGSIRAGYVDTETGNPLGIPNYYQNKNEFSFSEETVFGAQANIELPGKWDAAVQVISRGVHDFRLEANWAYLGYRITPNHYVRMGRFAMPLFRHSEYEYVGYTHDYATLPKSLYFGFDFNTVDGVVLDSKFFLDSGLFIKTKVMTGQWKGELSTSVNSDLVEAQFSNVWSISGSVHWDEVAGYAGYFKADNISDDLNDQLFGVLDPLLAPLDLPKETKLEIQDNLSFNKPAYYGYLGINWEPGNWRFNWEVAKYGITDSVDSFNLTYYASVGYQYNDVTTVTLTKQGYHQSTDDYPQTDGIDNPIAQAVIRATVDQFAGRELDAYGLSVRYEVNEQIAFKAEVVMGEDKRESVGEFSIFTVGFDFIF